MHTFFRFLNIRWDFCYFQFPKLQRMGNFGNHAKMKFEIVSNQML